MRQHYEDRYLSKQVVVTLRLASKIQAQSNFSIYAKSNEANFQAIANHERGHKAFLTSHRYVKNDILEESSLIV